MPLSSKTKYGCNCAKVEDAYWVRDLKITVNHIQPQDVWMFIPDNMTKKCMYDCRQTDPKCEGCDSE